MKGKRYWIFPVFLPNMGCPHRCVFCDQRAVTGRDAGLPSLEALEALFGRVRFSPKNRNAEGLTRQIAFYGGNFTGLPSPVQRRFLDWASEKVHAGLVDGIRFSTRPDALPAETLAFLQGYPIDIIEIGVQSLNDTVLESAGRGHTSEDCEKAVAAVHKMGWESGVQLMPGLPGDSLKVFLQGIRRVVAWGIRTVRLYPAVVLEGTLLSKRYWSGQYRPLSIAEAVSWCAQASEILDEAGVQIIRMGLPASNRLAASVVAGPYHPAFGFLVQSARFHQNLRGQMQHLPKGAVKVKIHLAPSDIPLLMGESRKAWEILKTTYGEKDLSYEPDPSLPRGTVRLTAS